MRSVTVRASVFTVLAILAARLPASAQSTYSVVPGDTLWSISSRFHEPIAVLEAHNHLTDASILKIGRQLVVAGSAARTTHIAHRRFARRAAAASRLTSSAGAKRAIWVATHTGEAPAPPVPISYSLAERIVAFDAKVTRTALRYVGVPYVFGGTTFGGMDCSGFVQAVFEHNGISLPRTADSQFEVGSPVRTSDLRAGDLVFFETYSPGPSHVGIYIGKGQFIHASASSGVRVNNLSEDYFAERYLGARRLMRS